MMFDVVNLPYGTAHDIAPVLPGIQVAAKTGTAQNGPNNTGLDDAVFTCFAPLWQPGDSCRRRGKGRWPRRRCLRPGGRADHQGIPELPPLIGEMMGSPDQRLAMTQDGYDKCET